MNGNIHYTNLKEREKNEAFTGKKVKMEIVYTNYGIYSWNDYGIYCGQ